MNKKLIISLLLGLIIRTNCDSTYDTQINDAGLPINVTSKQLSEASAAILWFYEQVKSLDDSLTPQFVAFNFNKYVNQITNMSGSLNEFGVIMANKNSTKNQLLNYANLSDVWHDFTHSQSYIYLPVAYTLSVIEFAKGKEECYNIFNYADEQGYLGISPLADYFFNVDGSKENEYFKKFSEICEKEKEKTHKILNQLLDALVGTGDQNCSLLQDLEEGLLSVQIFTGYRDLIANSLGYIMLDVQWLQVLLSGCYSFNGLTDSSQDITSQYQDKVQLVIDRYNEIDQNLTKNFNQTIQANLGSILDLFSAGLDPSAYVGASEVDLYLPFLYRDQRFLIFAYSFNSSSNDSVAVSCQHCLQREDESGLRYVIDWVDNSTTSSIANRTFDSIGQNEISRDAQQLANALFSVSSFCPTGVIAINKDTEQYIIQHLDDRYTTFNTTDLNVYLWGVNEDCQG